MRNVHVAPLKAQITDRHSVEFSIAGNSIAERWHPEELELFTEADLLRLVDAERRFLDRVAAVRGIRIRQSIVIADSEDQARAATLAVTPAGGRE